MALSSSQFISGVLIAILFKRYRKAKRKLWAIELLGKMREGRRLLNTQDGDIEKLFILSGFVDIDVDPFQ